MGSDLQTPSQNEPPYAPAGCAVYRSTNPDLVGANLGVQPARFKMIRVKLIVEQAGLDGAPVT